MKMRNTNEDLIAAIIRAIVTVIAPREICVTATEVSVKPIKPASTKEMSYKELYDFFHSPFLLIFLCNEIKQRKEENPDKVNQMPV